jgi:hypothetical protein
MNSGNMPMTCKNRGPFHLGISREACENAGGRWYRSPCVTLKQCIDDRPPRFKLDAPQVGSCQTTPEQLNTAYVSSTLPINSVRKVKIQLTGNYTLHMREVQVFDYNDTNVAYRKYAEQSTTYGSYPASRAVDGNLNTWSHTNWEPGKHQCFIFQAKL